MATADVSLTVRTITPPESSPVSIIDVSGEINSFAEQALMKAYAQATAAGARSIALNFTDLSFMNSSGIGLLITLLVRAKRNGHKLLAYGLNEHFTRVFTLTRLNDAIHLYPGEAEALQAAQAAPEGEAIAADISGPDSSR